MLDKLISVLMDDYKDSVMLVDYAEEAMKDGKKDIACYFADRAEKRMRNATEVEKMIGAMNDHKAVYKAYQDYNEEVFERLQKRLDGLF